MIHKLRPPEISGFFAWHGADVGIASFGTSGSSSALVHAGTDVTSGPYSWLGWMGYCVPTRSKHVELRPSKYQTKAQ
jgi:NADH:ubiquinone oxidoreductase subunit